MLEAAGETAMGRDRGRRDGEVMIRSEHMAWSRRTWSLPASVGSGGRAIGRGSRLGIHRPPDRGDRADWPFSAVMAAALVLLATARRAAFGLVSFRPSRMYRLNGLSLGWSTTRTARWGAHRLFGVTSATLRRHPGQRVPEGAVLVARG